MRKRVWLLVVVSILISAFMLSCGKQGKAAGGTAEVKTWAPSRNVDFICTNSPGGGSDIFARTIADIIQKEGLVPQPIIVSNRTDGNGEAARAAVSQMSAGVLNDHTLLAFNADDTINMTTSTDRRVTDFRHLALMATDKHLFYYPKGSNLQNFDAVVNRIKSGQSVSVAGSRGTDPTIIDLLRQQMGWTEAQMPYVMERSSADAITQLLGNHVELIISKPAAANPYVESGDLVPFLAFNTQRFTGNLANAPTMKESGYNDVEFPNWRTVAVSPNMSPEAQAYWISVLEKVTKTTLWQDDYIKKFQVIGVYMEQAQATNYVIGIQNDLLKLLGKSK